MGAGISYDPGIASRGDQYIFAGLSSLGQDVGKAIHESLDERRKQEQLQGYNDAIVNHAAQTGLITPEELNKYNAASLTQKTSMAAGYAANIHDDLQRQLTGAQTGNIQSETAARNLITPVQATNIASETNSRNTLLPTQVDNVKSETTLRNINALLGMQEGALRTQKLKPGSIDRIMENGQFKGWKITQPDGNISIKTPGSDMAELLAGLGFGAAAAGGGNTAGGGPPPPPPTVGGSRVTIYKNGRPAGTVPAAQAQLAVQQGYSLTP